MRKKIAFLVFGVLSSLIFITLTWDYVFRYANILPKVNYILYDATLKLFPLKNKAENVVIVDIDERSLQAEGKWAWPRSKIAELVSNLQADGAAVIAFDILFPEEDLNAMKVVLQHITQHSNIDAKTRNYLAQNLPAFDNDMVLARVLTKSDTVLGVFFNNENGTPIGTLSKPLLAVDANTPLTLPKMRSFTSDIAPLIKATSHIGCTTTFPDEDGVIRRSPLLIQYKNAIYPSLALEAARVYLLANRIFLDSKTLDHQQVMLGVQLADIYIPTDYMGQVLIPYGGPAFTIAHVSATDILHHNFKPETFADKIVFLGSSAIGIGDLHAIPLQATGYPGVEVHANIAAAILNKNFIYSPLWLVGLERVLLVAIGIAFTLLMLWASVINVILLTIFSEIIIFGLQIFFWYRWHGILPHMILPYLQMLFLGIASIIYGYFFESRYRKRLHEVYGQYVSATHIDKMLANPDDYTMAGRSKNMSVLFSDIRNFTSIAEKLNAEGVKGFLNSLFTPLTEIIFVCKGTIDKYVGDMIMAFWNDPLEDPMHPQHAVEAALKMIAKVDELAPMFAAHGISNVKIGIGVNTGYMDVGDMGSKYRKAYTVLGDAVNLASRLESANKFYGTNILVTEDTKNACQGIVFRLVDLVCVKGKSKPIKIYEPLCFNDAKSSSLDCELQEYENALQAYYSCNFCQAKLKFNALCDKYPRVALYKMYTERLAKFDDCPPPENWDGAFVLSQK